MKYLKFLVIVYIIGILSACSSNIRPYATSISQPTKIPTQIPTNTPVSTPTITPAPTPFAGISNQLIAFQNEYLGPVFTAKMNGDNQVKVTASIPGYVYEWGWSPDRKWLLISTINAKPSQLGTVYGKYILLWLVSPDGSEKHKMGQGFMRDVVWSPDGTHLIFMEDKGGKSSAFNTQAYIYNLDTFERKAFLEGIITSNPVYLQDGSLYFNALQEQKGSKYYTSDELFLSPDGSIGHIPPRTEPTNMCLNPDEVDFKKGFSLNTMKGKIIQTKSDFIIKELFCLTSKVDQVKSSDIGKTDISKEIFTPGSLSYKSERLILASSITLKDLSPDEKWITLSQYDEKGQLSSNLVLSTEGGDPVSIDTHDPHWSPDSRNLIDIQKVEDTGKYKVYAIDISTLEKHEFPELNWLAETPRLFQWSIQPNDPGPHKDVTGYLRNGNLEKAVLDLSTVLTPAVASGPGNFPTFIKLVSYDFKDLTLYPEIYNLDMTKGDNAYKSTDGYYLISKGKVLLIGLGKNNGDGTDTFTISTGIIDKDNKPVINQATNYRLAHGSLLMIDIPYWPGTLAYSPAISGFYGCETTQENNSCPLPRSIISIVVNSAGEIKVPTLEGNWCVHPGYQTSGYELPNGEKIYWGETKPGKVICPSIWAE